MPYLCEKISNLMAVTSEVDEKRRQVFKKMVQGFGIKLDGARWQWPTGLPDSSRNLSGSTNMSGSKLLLQPTVHFLTLSLDTTILIIVYTNPPKKIPECAKKLGLTVRF